MTGHRGTIPPPALVLGWAGVIPFAALAVASVSDVALPAAPTTALVAYAAAILSFMGGAQWGLATAAAGSFDRSWIGYGVSVLPALAAWSALLAPPALAFGLLIPGFALLLAYDLWTVRRGFAPGWYGRLRIRLTAAVVLALAVALGALWLKPVLRQDACLDAGGRWDDGRCRT